MDDSAFSLEPFCVFGSEEDVATFALTVIILLVQDLWTAILVNVDTILWRGELNDGRCAPCDSHVAGRRGASCFLQSGK